MNNTILKLNQVSFKIPFRNQPIVDGASFAIQTGDFVVLVGSNGSGKSSLIKLINRTYPVTTGNIMLQEKSLFKYNNKFFSKEVITMTQNVNDSLFTDMSILENMILLEMRSKSFFDFKGHKARALDIKKYLMGFNQKLAENLSVSVGNLSGGEKQILVLAMGLRYSPKLILLDEHTSALDPKTSELIMEKTYQAIFERGITCVMTTHNLDYALRFGNRLLAIREGKIIHDYDHRQKQSLTRAELLKNCY